MGLLFRTCTCKPSFSLARLVLGLLLLLLCEYKRLDRSLLLFPPHITSFSSYAISRIPSPDRSTANSVENQTLETKKVGNTSIRDAFKHPAKPPRRASHDTTSLHAVHTRGKGMAPIHKTPSEEGMCSIYALSQGTFSATPLAWNYSLQKHTWPNKVRVAQKSQRRSAISKSRRSKPRSPHKSQKASPWQTAGTKRLAAPTQKPNM